MLRFLPGHTVGTRRNLQQAEATRGHCACVNAAARGIKLADPGITTEPRGLTASQSRLADMFSTAAFSGRSAALDVCVASSTAAAARGDAAQLSPGGSGLHLQ